MKKPATASHRSLALAMAGGQSFQLSEVTYNCWLLGLGADEADVNDMQTQVLVTTAMSYSTEKWHAVRDNMRVIVYALSQWKLGDKFLCQMLS